MNRMLPIALVAAALALAACEKTPETEAPVVRPVLSIVAAPRGTAQSGFAGIVEPRYQTDLGFRVLGRIISRSANVGDLVKAGTRLATLDPLILGLAARSSQADLAKAQSDLTNAAATETRLKTLLAQKSASQADFDTAQAARATAAAAVLQGQANLAKANEQLSYTQLLADSDGVVTAVSAEVGQTVAAGQTVVSVARPDVREAVIDLPDEIAGALDVGAPFEIRLQLDPSLTVAGKVREVAPQADASTRTRRVKISLVNPAEAFRLGTTVTAFPTVAAADTIDLPRSALLDRDDKSFVWIVDPVSSKVASVPVTVAGGDEATVHIASGVKPGDRVVTAGVHSLVEGQAVQIRAEMTP